MNTWGKELEEEAKSLSALRTRDCRRFDLFLVVMNAYVYFPCFEPFLFTLWHLLSFNYLLALQHHARAFID